MRSVFITLYGIIFLVGLMFSGCSVGDSHIKDFRPDDPNDELVDPELDPDPEPDPEPGDEEWEEVVLPESVNSGNFYTLLKGLRIYDKYGAYLQLSEDGQMVLYFVDEKNIAYTLNIPLLESGSNEMIAFYTDNDKGIALLYNRVISTLPFLILGLRKLIKN